MAVGKSIIRKEAWDKVAGRAKAAIAPVLSGVIGHAVSAKAPFMVAMALALAAFLFLVWHKHEPSATKTV